MSSWVRNAGRKFAQVIIKPWAKAENDTRTSYVRYQDAVARGHVHVKVFADTTDLLIIPMKRIGTIVTGGYIFAGCVRELKSPGAFKLRAAGLASVVRGDSPFRFGSNVSVGDCGSPLARDFATVLKEQGISRVVTDKMYEPEAFACQMALWLQEKGLVEPNISQKSAPKDATIPPCEVTAEKFVPKGLQTVGVKGTEEDAIGDGGSSVSALQTVGGKGTEEDAIGDGGSCGAAES